MRERAQGRCEYCLVHEEDLYLPHEPDHIIAEKHGGATTLDNLAWACVFCNRNKGSDIASIDHQTGEVAALFHPRKQLWRRHFHLNGPLIEPLTANGRATEYVLQMNSEPRIAQRIRFMSLGHYPLR